MITSAANGATAIVTAITIAIATTAVVVTDCGSPLSSPILKSGISSFPSSSCLYTVGDFFHF